MHIGYGFVFTAGFGLGVYFALYILDKLYKCCMKDAIDEIHKRYIEALDIMKERYDTKSKV